MAIGRKAIEKAAYFHWISRGRPRHDDWTDWFRAEREARKPQYIIATTTSLRPCLSGLVEQKLQRGYHVHWIIGASDPSALRAEVLERTGPRGSCLLLVGDHDQIPGYPMRWDSNDFLSDSYLSMREGDVVPSLHTGRLSTNDPDVLSKICQRLLRYPFGGAELPWLRRVILTGWVPRVSEFADPSGDPDAGWRCIHEIGSHFNVIKRFQNDRSCSPERRAVWGVGEEDSKRDLVDAINGGAQIVRYLGHGHSSGWSNIGDGEQFRTADVEALSVGNYLPFVISSACLTGDIEVDQSFAEIWLTNGAAVGIFAADTIGATYWGDRITQRIFHQIVSRGRRKVGEVLNDAMMQLYEDFRDIAPGAYARQSLVWMPRLFRYLGDPDTRLPGPVEPTSAWIEEGEVYGDYAVVRIQNAGARSGEYTFHVGPGRVEARRNGDSVGFARYNWQTTVSASDPSKFYTFRFSNVLAITIRKSGSGTINLRNIQRSIFDGQKVLRIEGDGDPIP